MSRRRPALFAHGLALALLGLVVSALANPARADSIRFYGAPVGEFSAPIVTWRDMPFRTVVRQRYDYSCGSAALATLLRFHHNRSVGEADVFRAMWDAGDREKIQRLGFSMLDMKLYLQGIGYRADGFQIGLDQLARMNRPAIALINLGAYKHFVVIKGLSGDQVLVGDPNRGLRLVARAEFERQWNGIAFVIHGGPERGRFNAADDWAQVRRLPVQFAQGETLGQVLSDLTLIYQLAPTRLIDAPAN